MSNAATVTFSPIQEKVILALAEGSTITAAARSLAIHRSTIYKWLADPAFAEVYELARVTFRNTMGDQLEELAAAAVDTIRHLITSPDTPPAVRLRAALAILQRNNTSATQWTLPAPVPDLRKKSTQFDTLQTSPETPPTGGPLSPLDTANGKTNPSPASGESAIPAPAAPIRRNSTQFDASDPVTQPPAFTGTLAASSPSLCYTDPHGAALE